MATLAEKEPKPREQLPKAPEGTFAWLEQYDGFEEGMSLPDKPLLCIGKENICHAYGCSCMDFLVHRRVSEDTQIQIDGHITDRDEITELVKITIKISDGVVNSRQEDFIGINEAMQEVRDAMSVLQVPEHTPTR